MIESYLMPEQEATTTHTSPRNAFGENSSIKIQKNSSNFEENSMRGIGYNKQT